MTGQAVQMLGCCSGVLAKNCDGFVLDVTHVGGVADDLFA